MRGGGTGSQACSVADIDGEGRGNLADPVQMSEERTADILETAPIRGLRLAEPGEHNAADRQIRRRDNRQQLVALAAKAWRGGERSRDRAAAGVVELTRRRG